MLAAWLAAAMTWKGVLADPPPRRIVTSFYPIYIATLNVVRDAPGVTVTNMTSAAGGCLHDYQLTPRDLETLVGADILVINGAGLEAFLGRALRQAPRLTVIDAGAGLDFIGPPEAPNPHVWLSVSNAIRQARTIAAGLGRLDPERAAVYDRNAAAYGERLDALRLRMQTALLGARTRDIVTFHEAFPYFAREFGLRVAAVIEREPGSAPSARELADTIALVKRTGVQALFVEPQYPPDAAHVVARETGASVHVLDPIVTGPLEPDAYLKIMEANLQTLLEALK